MTLGCFALVQKTAICYTFPTHGGGSEVTQTGASRTKNLSRLQSNLRPRTDRSQRFPSDVRNGNAPFLRRFFYAHRQKEPPPYGTESPQEQWEKCLF